MGHFDTFCACGTDKVVVTEKRCSAYKESENIDDNADSDQVVVFEKKFPPVSIVRGKSSKLMLLPLTHSIGIIYTLRKG